MALSHAHAPVSRPGESTGERRAANSRRMWVALAINGAMFALGLAGGLVFDSLALLADAGHLLSDVGAIALGLGAARLAARPGSARRTFGYQRGEVIAALVNGVVLVAVATAVVVAAVNRFGDPPDVRGGGVLILGAIGLAGNLVATLVLAGGRREDINLEAVLRHSAADALGSLGVVVTGVVVLAGGSSAIDPVMGIAIAALIVISSVRLIAEPLDVLMESAPAGTDVEEIARAMCSVPGVEGVHELHVWTVTSGFEALAAHVVAAAGADRDRARRELEYLLRDRFGIAHTTLQMEESADESALLQVQSRLQQP